MDAQVWDVPVVDGLDRPRSLVVTVSGGRVAVVPPPGEGFYLPPHSIWQLHEAVRAAALAAAGSVDGAVDDAVADPVAGTAEEAR